MFGVDKRVFKSATVFFTLLAVSSIAYRRYKFAAWHPGVLSRLPRDVLEGFPAVILPYSAVDRRLITRIEQSLVQRYGGLQTLADHLEEAHKVEFHTRELR